MLQLEMELSLCVSVPRGKVLYQRTGSEWFNILLGCRFIQH